MKYNSNRSLNGQISQPYRTLNGGNMYSNDLPTLVKQLKEKLFNFIVIPLINGNTQSVLKNAFLLPRIKTKFTQYQMIYKHLGLNFYNELIQLLEKIIEHIEENEAFQAKMLELNDGVGDFRVRVHRVRLLAQYEVYNLIFGAPPKGQRYDDMKIGFIKTVIQKDNLSYEEIEKIVLKEFPINE